MGLHHTPKNKDWTTTYPIAQYTPTSLTRRCCFGSPFLKYLIRISIAILTGAYSGLPSPEEEVHGQLPPLAAGKWRLTSYDDIE